MFGERGVKKSARGVGREEEFRPAGGRGNAGTAARAVPKSPGTRHTEEESRVAGEKKA